MRLTDQGIVTDDGTFVGFARAPGQVAEQRTSGASVSRGAASGNPNYDPSSGRFAAKSQSAVEGDKTNPVAVNPLGLPQGVTQEEWDRRRDAVKDAARSIESLDPDKLVAFLKTRVTDLSSVDMAQFAIDVLDQKVSDLTDIFAQQMTRGRNAVQFKTARSYATRAIGEMSDDQIGRILTRLEARGFSRKDIRKKVIARLPEDKRDAFKSVFK